MYVICFDYRVGHDNLQRVLPTEFLQIYFWMVNEVLNEPEIILWVLTAGFVVFFSSCSTGIVLTLTESKQTNPRNQSNKQTKTQHKIKSN